MGCTLAAWESEHIHVLLQPEMLMIQPWRAISIHVTERNTSSCAAAPANRLHCISVSTHPLMAQLWQTVREYFKLWSSSEAHVSIPMLVKQCSTALTASILHAVTCVS